jgi:acetolactate synthase-1/2/3 large subunit
MKGADAIARILKQEGVDFMGIIPMNTLEESAAQAGIRPLIFRQERVGVNMADGYSRVTNGRGIGVFSMQAGPGAENAFAGVAHAYADSVPILMLPASSGWDRKGIHPDFSPVSTYRDVTKWSAQITTPERIPAMMRQAFTQLRTGRLGPVLIDMPRDVLRGDISDDAAASYVNVTPRRSAGDPQDIKEAARMLLSAKNPIIQAGQGVLYAEAWDELIELAELIQIPVMTTMAGKSAFPENHALSLGTRSGTTTGGVVHWLNESDMIFNIGTSMTALHYGADLIAEKVLIHSTNELQDLNKDYDPDHAIIGDAKLVLGQLIAEIKEQLGDSTRVENGKVADEVKAVKDAWLGEWMDKLTSEETPINPYRVIWDLMNTIDRKKSIVTHDSGSPRDQSMPFYEAISPRGFIGWGKSTQLGYSLGIAMGAKMAAPEKLAVNIIGDYGFGFVGMDIETAVREKIPVLTIVLNNSTMGIYSPSSFPTANDLYGTKSTGGEYAKVAEALGGYNERVDKPSEVVPAIRRAEKVISNGQPALLEIITSEEHAFPFRGAVGGAPVSRA